MTCFKNLNCCCECSRLRCSIPRRDGPMRKLFLIGIGAGNPEYITVQAIKALNLVDVFFFMDKGEAKQDLVNFRKQICEQYIENKSYRVVEAEDPVRDPAIPDYTTRVEHWHRQRALIYEELIAQQLEEDQCGAFLVWGDPSLYDSTLRVIDHIVAVEGFLSSSKSSQASPACRPWPPATKYL